MSVTHHAYIGIGSNLDKPMEQVNLACQAIRKHPQLHLKGISPWYASKAVGPGEQPDYVNGVLYLTTPSSPETLLHLLQTIENTHGRTRTVKWGPRTLDLDILIFDNCVIDTPNLRIPHPHLHERNFVLAPLHDLQPELTLPNGIKVSSLLRQVGMQNLKKL